MEEARGGSEQEKRRWVRSSKWLRLRQQNEILHSYTQRGNQACVRAACRTWTKSPVHKATFYRPDVHFVCTLSWRGLCSRGPGGWIWLPHTLVACKAASVCCAVTVSHVPTGQRHAAHASTTVYPCMHVPTKHALSFAHGDRSFKGVFHTSSHFN